jgi:hypothetical protein
MTDQEAEDLAHNDAIAVWMEIQEITRMFSGASTYEHMQVTLIETALMRYANTQLTSIAEELDEEEV